MCQYVLDHRIGTVQKNEKQEHHQNKLEVTVMAGPGALNGGISFQQGCSDSSKTKDSLEDQKL